ncbi:MAG: D-2-hydroxyacid dehydrogenase [Oscillospiraceae bacterium]|nr:D-2-hydroxyacid dehydrogenase [Oscillospiraceae bacterium]
MEIVILDGHALNHGDLSWKCFEQFGTVRYFDRTEGESETIERIGNAEIIILNKVNITDSILEACPSIKLICILATGYNVVDCEAAAKRGIPVCNAPGYGTDSVAQFTFALLLELCHHVSIHSDSVHSGEWSSCSDFCYWKTPQMELAGKTMGIIGYGAIGQAVGRIAKAFGLNVLACNRTRRTGDEYVSLDELLEKSDIISLHCPLFPENKGIINAETINKMKDGVILLNTARGGLLDEKDVANALSTKKIRCAAVDVVSSEPISRENPLLTAPNCIITPHMAWAPIEARQRILDIAVNSIHGFINGDKINVVNM